MDQVDLSPFFKTKSQASDFSARLAVFSEKIYSTTFDLDKELLDQLGMQKKDKFITLLRDSKISIDKPADLKGFVDRLRQYVTTLPVLSLTFAFEPKEQSLKRLSEWFGLNSKKQVLFDITVDPTIIAGTTLTYNGKFLDYSIKPKIDQLMQQLLDGTPPTSETAEIKATAVTNIQSVAQHLSAEHLHL
jgi:hypothetical protein